MAVKLAVAVAILAVCHASPLLIKGAVFRDGRSFSIGQAYASNSGLPPTRISQASGAANSNGGNSLAYGSAETIVNPYPVQTVAQAENYEVPSVPVYDQAAKAVAEAQNIAFYPVAYQNFEVPVDSYEPPAPPAGPVIADSYATMNGGYDASSSSASTTGLGAAQSSAQTQRGAGNVGATMSNAKTYGSGYGSAASNANNGYASAATNANTAGYGSAAANANTGYGSANTASRTQGMGGLSSATSQAQGGSGSSNTQAQTMVNNGHGSAASKTQGYGNSYGSASSAANMVGMYGNAMSSAKTSNQKGHHWHFGTLYDNPIPTLNHAKSHSVGFGAVDESVDVNGVGFPSTKAAVNSGYGVAQSLANSQGSMGSVMSSANTVNGGYGSANSNAAVNGAEFGSAKSAAQTNGLGYGSATSSANTGPGYGSMRNNGLTNGSTFGSRTQANAQTSGSGSANSSARTQGLSTGYRVANSAAKSNGYGSAHANAQSM